MAWKKLVGAYKSLVRAVEAGDGLDAAWKAYEAVVAECEANDRPYHLRGLIRQIEAHAGGRAREEIAILDHGCGGGLTLLYLIALGYTNVYGVDVNDSPCERWNRLTSEILGHDDQRFFVYSGRELPIESGSIDLVFSQEVLEHVHPDVLESYYAEEGRVLKPGGLALHSVPHRLVPYDSHTQTWFLHWFLPRAAWIRLLKAMGKDVYTAEVALFLRWPWRHKHFAKRYLGDVEDRTLDRLRELQSFEYYDGPLGLRRMVATLVRTPVIGAVCGGILSNFVMIDTVSRKPG